MTWHVACIEPNAERRAERTAPQFGIETFLPLILQRTQGRVTVRPVLMFPGYMFMNVVDLDAWYRAKRETFIFVRLLAAAAGVAERIVAELKSRATDGVLPEPEYSSQFHVGQRVRVARGERADLYGLVQDTAPGRVGVLLTLFGRQMTLDLDESLVVAA